MRSTNIRWMILLGTLAILSIIAVQTYSLIQQWSHESQSFHQTTSRALLNVAHKMAELNGSTLPREEIIKRITPNYYIVNFNDTIDANILEHFLYEEFSSLHTYTDFEYGIYNCSTDEMVYGNHCNLIEGNKAERVEGNLPKYDEFLYYFGVKFPSRQQDLRANTGLTWLMALIAFITVTFFSYAIWVILSQRRYSEMQRDFINNMTHEFKTPLTSIQLSSDYLSKQEAIRNDDRLRKYTELIRSQYQRLNSQVEKLLNVARLESGEFKLKPEKINVHQLLDEVIETKGAESGIEGRIFKKSFAAQLDSIEGDRSHISSVFSNLIDNAVKYSPQDKPIDITTSTAPGKIMISFVDRGIGIAPQHQRHLFKKFYRVPSGNVHDIKGFGLGLHYVRKIVQLHHGEIRVKSELGQGSTFTLELPTITS